jgi:hypothetical protein
MKNYPTVTIIRTQPLTKMAAGPVARRRSLLRGAKPVPLLRRKTHDRVRPT